jgi:hypothetical protein
VEAILERRGWLGLYQFYDEFAAFLKEDQATVTATLKDVGLIN